MNQWAARIALATTVLEQIRGQDLDGIWQVQPPSPPAKDVEIDAVERALGHALDTQYRSFLAHANGWPAFYQAVDLFGTPQLLGGAPMDTVLVRLDAITEQDFQSATGVERRDALAVAGSARQGDIFFLLRPWSRWAGSVIWFDGEVFERFAGFSSFFDAMIEYNEREVRYLEAEHPAI